MIRLAWLVPIVWCACGPSTSAVKAPSNAGGVANACPAPDRVVVLEWKDASTPDGGAPIAAGWRAYLTNRSVDHDKVDGLPEYKTITADEARAAGATLPASVWVYTGDRAPCRATVGAAFRSVMQQGPVSEQVGVELGGCARPAENMPPISFGFALDAGADVTGCAWNLSEDAALRAGGNDDSGEHWKAPTEETPIPAEVAGLVPTQACAVPACEHLWSVRRAGPAAAPLAYDVVQTWLKPDATKSPCELESTSDASIFVRGPAGLVNVGLGEDGGNDALVGVFADGGGARLLITEDAGWFGVYQVGAKTTRAVHRRWFDANEEDNNYRSVAPYCGP